MPIFHCDNCRFIFKRTKEVDACPDCGKPEVRPATDKEIKLFLQEQTENKGNVKESS